MILVPMAALGHLAETAVAPPTPAALIPVPEMETLQQQEIRLKMETVLAVYRLTASIHKAVAAVKMTVPGHKHWLKGRVVKDGVKTEEYIHPEYRAAYVQAQQELKDTVYSEAYVRAIHGIQELLIVNGKPVMGYDEQGNLRPLLKNTKSDSLLMMFLRATNPMFQEHRKREDLAPSQIPPAAAAPAEEEYGGEVDLKRLSDGEAQQLRALYAKATGEGDAMDAASRNGHAAGITGA